MSSYWFNSSQFRNAGNLSLTALSLSKYGLYQGYKEPVLVIQNPSIGKSFGIAADNFSSEVYGFGVCLVTKDPIIVEVIQTYKVPWRVKVLTLTLRVWNGANEETINDGEYTTNPIVVSFDLISKKFKVVDLPHNLRNELDGRHVVVANLKESLVVYGSIYADGAECCDVWVMERDSFFRKLFTIGERMEIELDSINKNNTWTLTTLPTNQKAIGLKWVFKTKRDAKGKIIKYKARAAVRLPDPKLKTLGKRSIECIFVGYVEHSKAFRFYVIEPNDSVAINSIIESMDVIFDEHRFSSILKPSQRSRVKGTEDSGEEAINDEMDSIMSNNTLVLTDLPPGCRTLGCRWIFKRKLKVDGTVEKFKARLVIQRFKQKSGINYFDTYALVARISTIRLLIAMASIHNLIIHHIDAKTDFLNGKLEEEVYMNQPLGFIMPGNENKVCKLIKSLYGLKQGPKQWHQKFDEVVLSNGYLLNQADKCVYSKFDASEFLSSRFSMKDMGEADVILGIRIKHESNGIAISQSHYIEKVLKKFNYSDCTLVRTSLDTCEKLMPNRGLVVSQLEYSRVIGCLMYAITCTRPDIAFDVGKLSRMIYSGYPLVLEGYTDASWISNTEDNSSTSDWVKPMSPISIRYDSAATCAKTCSQMYNGKSRHLGVRHSMIRELITNVVVSTEFRAEAHVLQIIPMMCLEPAGKEDEVANFSMVNFFEKVLSMSMNKEESPIYPYCHVPQLTRLPVNRRAKMGQFWHPKNDPPQFIYWGAYEKTINDDGEYTTSRMVMSFDLITKEFNVVDLPHKLRNKLDGRPVAVANLRESLVVYGCIYDDGAECGDVWVMEHDSSFRKLFTIDERDPELVEFCLSGYGFCDAADMVLYCPNRNLPLKLVYMDWCSYGCAAHTTGQCLDMKKKNMQQNYFIVKRFTVSNENIRGGPLVRPEVKVDYPAAGNVVTRPATTSVSQYGGWTVWHRNSPSEDIVSPGGWGYCLGNRFDVGTPMDFLM
nr:zinc finger, CCHC-type [Tanacetum cinerariifolium]